MCQIATGSYVGNGQYTLSLNLGFSPKKIFFSRNFEVGDPSSSLKYVNGVSQGWSGFTGIIVGEPTTGRTVSVTSIPNIRSYSFEDSNIFIPSYYYESNTTVYKITLSYNDGIATFTQDCYFNTSSHSATIPKQNASYSMNLSSVIYNYLAIG